MDRLSGEQFHDYLYRVHRDERGSTTVVAAKNTRRMASWGGMVGILNPVGALHITHHANIHHNDEQQDINRGAYPHGMTTEEGGQRRWTEGWMEPVRNPSHVSWLGIDPDQAGGNVLRNMMAVGVAHHGFMPHADSELTEAGAKISRGMARKYGMKPHPNNPDMTPTVYSRVQGTDYEWSRRSNDKYWTRLLDKPTKDYTHEQASGIASRMAEDYRPSQPTDRPPRGQMKLF